MQSITGFSFIELMLSMFLIALILLGINAAHIVAINETKSSYYYALASKQAMMLAASFMEERQQSRAIVTYFKQHIQKMLPNGRLQVESRINGQVRILIYWGDASEDDCDYDRIGRSGCVAVKRDV